MLEFNVFDLNGARYNCVDISKPLEMTLCWGEKRMVFTGLLSLKAVTNRDKFPDELVVTFRVEKGCDVKEEVRNNSGWNTVEAYLPLELGVEWLKKTLGRLRGDLTAWL